LLKLALVLTRIKRFTLLVFLLVFPLQGLAAAIAPVLCLGGGSHHDATHGGTTAHAHGSHDHGSHGHDSPAPAHEHGKAEPSTSGDSTGHMECHHVFSGVPVAFPRLPTPDLPVFQAAISSAVTLYVPELPQRPPRA
jgi:hypothetical protein